VLTVARAELARHQAEVGFDLVRVTEALGVVERRDEGGRGHGPDAGDGAQALNPQHARPRARSSRRNTRAGG
jgi:hypothetical protein